MNQPAIAALFHVAAECRRPASFDCHHHTPIDPAGMRAMMITERCAVAAEDICHL